MLGAALLLLTGGCRRHNNDELAHHHHEHGGGEEVEMSDEIHLAESVADRFGIVTEKAENRQMSAVVKVGAVVEPSAEGLAVVTAPAAGIVSLSPGIDLGAEVKAGAVVATVRADAVTGGDANRVAKVDLEAAKTEYERAASLYADRLITVSDYNAACAAYERAKAAYSATAATGRAASPITGVVTSIDARSGQYVEAGAPIANVAASTRLTIRANVPARQYRDVASARDARVSYGSGRSVLLSELDGRRLDINSTAGSMAGYVPVTFSVRNDGSLIPGEAVDLYILGESDRTAISVPVTALSEQQGAFFVYQRLDEDCYRKLPVAVGSNDGRYVEVVAGLAGDEDIVVEGVTAVRLAETSGVVPEGHTHSH